jgi:hypothetical protein
MQRITAKILMAEGHHPDFAPPLQGKATRPERWLEWSRLLNNQIADFAGIHF